VILVGRPPNVGIVTQHHVQQGVVNLQDSVVLDEPKPAKFVHEMAYAGPRGADHLRERLLAYLRYDRLRLTLLPEVRHQEENSCQTFFARIEELVDQVRLNAGVPS
jgi:hypothetical protein